jgi:hypothetical protein
MRAFRTWRAAKRYIETFSSAHRLSVLLVEGTYMVGATDPGTRIARLDRRGLHLSVRLLDKVLPDSRETSGSES